jgi:MEMO1 family protein
MTRAAVVAGSFYEQDPARLRRQLDQVWPKPAPKCVDCLGAIVPHAGYVYSGHTAAEVYARLKPAETYFLLGPNHTGRGAAVAVASDQAWETPLGTVPVDAVAARRLLDLCAFAREDDQAHRREHSLEVQLPFLQKLGGEPRIVAVCLGTWDLPVLRAVGEAVAETARTSGRRCLVLASSDMNHFEDLVRTRRLDELALARIRALDPDGLIEVVTREEISMCGAGPAAVLLTAALALGAKRAEVVAYTTSAEASGDTDRVVGYAGVLLQAR